MHVCILCNFSPPDFVIVKCNLHCRENAHFHCCYCPATVIRKVQLITHLQKCKQKLSNPGQEAQSPLLHSPAATAPLPNILAQTSHVITQAPPVMPHGYPNIFISSYISVSVSTNDTVLDKSLMPTFAIWNNLPSF